jgi:bifunctional non-homologous end joining protein LigD
MSEGLPRPGEIAPMLVTLSPAVPAGDEYAYEMKWDGVRAVARVDGGTAVLTSRNDKDMTVSYPELSGAAPDAQLLLDGEIVAFDRTGAPSFRLLQRRMHVAGAADSERLAASIPAAYLVFDVLYADGRSWLRRPYEERRERLDELGLSGTWQVPPVFGRNGDDALAASKEHRLEGVVAKRLGSSYQPGVRNRDWLKVKNVRAQEVVIGGWKPGAGRRAGAIGSLLLGIPGENGLDYVGKVGTGFTDDALAVLADRLSPLERNTSPFPDIPRADARDAQWVSPSLVGEVAFGEWTGDGRLRHPAWRGLRADKSAADVIRESD